MFWNKRQPKYFPQFTAHGYEEFARIIGYSYNEDRNRWISPQGGEVMPDAMPGVILFSLRGYLYDLRHKNRLDDLRTQMQAVTERARVVAHFIDDKSLQERILAVADEMSTLTQEVAEVSAAQGKQPVKMIFD